ncbi:MAG: formylglycine-generating enzyme family protein [Cyanobacteriota bacterium]|nr:formylglycine-generating enzyme family protein [Cyanobacteriota bacterium]
MSASPIRQADGAGAFRFLLTHRRRAQGYREWLEPESVGLPMLWIPPGRFWMGSPDTEPDREASEGPQHLVQLQGFFLGQTPITQAQWRAVAQWSEREGERWGLELDPDPSFFQLESKKRRFFMPTSKFVLLEGEETSDQRPVDSVNWQEAMEFCHRLSQRTGRVYTLPSEAQWEYACRAGTTTPFHFGSTLSTALANYDGTHRYADGVKGVDRRQTTPVGLFPANAWGLKDMHGNVWEWCLDHWHDTYEGAPEDGRAWLDEKDPEDAMRLLRGGSWFDGPQVCRSAHRLRDLPDFAYGLRGFRVCCLPQD